MHASTNPKTKEELIRQVEAGEGVYAWHPGGRTWPLREGQITIVGPPAWTARVELKAGQIVKVIE